MKITILGSGTSQGVPRVGGKLNNGWGLCDPSNPKNRRRRVSIMVEHGDTRLIVDTGPDLREQCLSADIIWLNAVLYTHDHADHTHGIDDLRAIAQNMKIDVPVYGNKHTLDVLKRRFDYIFKNRKGYPSICTAHEIDTAPFKIGDIDVQPIELIHGGIITYGFRFGNVCYCTDFNDIPSHSDQLLEGLDVWIVDCLREEPHPTHCHLEQTLGYVDKYKPKHTILTHMTAEMDYETLRIKLPNGVEPAYDGMVISI
ncbi:MAG: MBL fold metallo-hydrolase [Kordiimonadaceae bacterium]|jgi:phosphoribosyl 1,2-cyclic phosphate phosphodiesterase|nr:MBL fold metallo-hydrolase [Kordiimonadaceae bacterium]